MDPTVAEALKIFYQHGPIGVVAIAAIVAFWRTFKAFEKFRNDTTAKDEARTAAHAKDVADLRDKCHREAVALYETLVESHKGKAASSVDLLDRISDLVNNLKSTYIRRK